MTGREAHRHPLSVTLQSTLQSPAQRGPRVTAGPCRWKHPTLCKIKLATCLTSEHCTRAIRAVRCILTQMLILHYITLYSVTAV